MRIGKFVLLAVAVVPIMACVQTAMPGAAAPERAGAGAIVKLMNAKGEAAGQAVLTAVPEGVEIVVSVTTLTPGLHGIHIHTNGSCAPGPDATGKTIDFGAAGGHFDPAATARHGDPAQTTPHHAGDAPNLSADAQGQANLRYINRLVALVPGTTSVIGKSLVVHADPDDYKTNPAGNSGARVLCGVIEAARFDAVVGRAQR